MSATKEQIEAIIAYVDTAITAAREHDGKDDATKETADQAEALRALALQALREISP